MSVAEFNSTVKCHGSCQFPSLVLNNGTLNNNNN